MFICLTAAFIFMQWYKIWWYKKCLVSYFSQSRSWHARKSLMGHSSPEAKMASIITAGYSVQGELRNRCSIFHGRIGSKAAAEVFFGSLRILPCHIKSCQQGTGLFCCTSQSTVTPCTPLTPSTPKSQKRLR